jgi:adenylate cyclase
MPPFGPRASSQPFSTSLQPSLFAQPLCQSCRLVDARKKGALRLRKISQAFSMVVSPTTGPEKPTNLRIARCCQSRLRNGLACPQESLAFPRNLLVFSSALAVLRWVERRRRNGKLLYSFEDYALDTDRRELRRGARLVSLSPKAFDLLAYVIQNRSRVVSRDDLLSSVWDGRIVSESALTTCINAARFAISDSGEEQRLIKTLPRKGIRFVGAVREEQEPTSSATEERTDSPRPALPLPDKPSIAILPFVNMSGDPAQEYFADGISEDIITELSQFSELFVIARNSSFQYKGKSIDVRQIGRELGVRYLLEGSVRRVGGRVRVAAQLVDALTGIHRWAKRYDSLLEDIFAIQDEVLRSIAPVLASHINKAEIERTLLKPPATWQAYDYNLRAVDTLTSLWSSFHAELLYEVRRLLERALSIDPTYARAYANLSMTYSIAWSNSLDNGYLNPATLDRAYQLACKAVQLDANLPHGHSQLGVVLTWRREHEVAVSEFEKALHLNASITDWRFALCLVLAGEPNRAIEVCATYMRLDPFFVPIACGFMGLSQYMAGHYAEALPLLRECVSRSPNYRHAHTWLAATFAQLGRREEAAAEVSEVLRIEPNYTILGTQRWVSCFKLAEHRDHFSDGLRKAGLPEA